MTKKRSCKFIFIFAKKREEKGESGHRVVVHDIHDRRWMLCAFVSEPQLLGRDACFLHPARRRMCTLMMNVDINWNNNSIKTTVIRGSLASRGRQVRRTCARAYCICTAYNIDIDRTIYDWKSFVINTRFNVGVKKQNTSCF